ncbi:MAG: hypothetical protein L7F77_04310 [Candidatus Magnetominusculus sp. LBB02]|nr:hypothetical protein [Candidatus Magnetominusculus sp. LBB02]
MYLVAAAACFFFIFLSFYKGHHRDGSRQSFMAATVVWGLLMAMSTEALSLFKALSFWPITVFWAVAAALSCLYYFVVISKPKPIESNPPPALSRFEIMLLAYTAFIFLATFVTATVSAPNNWDSMTYHLSRVMHWTQNASLSYYPTNVERQLFSDPGAEFALLHFIVLSGSDRFAALVQWFSMVGSVVGVSLIAGQLGADRRGQILAAALTASIPMGILQATSTQNDYAAAFWLVCFVYYALILKDSPTPSISAAVGIALGMAILVKSTSYFYVFPFALWCTVVLIKKSPARLPQSVLIIAVFVLTLNAGHFTRNLAAYGHPLAPQVWSDKGTIKGLSIVGLLSNTIKHIGLHMGTPSEGINNAVRDALIGLHKLLHINIRGTDAPSSSFNAFVIPFTFHEDDAGNLVHMLVICTALLLIRRQSDTMIVYAASLALAFMLMNQFLKWSPWNSRYHVALFVLSMPFAALCSQKNQKLTNAAIIIVLCTSLPWVFLNERRPLLGKSSIFVTSRTSQYFMSRKELEAPYTGAADIINARGCTDVGLLLAGEDSWEYPFWIVLNRANAKVRIEHVGVRNSSAMFSNNKFVPCAIISQRPEHSSNLAIGNSHYKKEWEMGNVMVLFRQP